MSAEADSVDAVMSLKGERRIIYVQYCNPAVFPPLEHSSKILADAGWRVLFLGIGALGEADELRFSKHEKIEVRQMAFCSAGWRQKLHYALFAVWVLASAVRWRPEYIYASDLLACPAAWLASLLPGVNVIYHEHDSPDTSGGTLFIRLCLSARRLLARRSSVCILPNNRRAEVFAQQTGIKTDDVLCVWNCPERKEAEIEREEHDDGSFWLLYHGSIVPERLPKTVLGALKMLPEKVKLRVIGYETVGYLGYVQELRETASRLGIVERVEFLGHLPTRSALLHWCRQSDVGFAFMPDKSSDINMSHMVGASNKPFDYLACGLALLVADLPDWIEMFVEPGYGMACNPNSPESIASALRWFLENPEQMHRMGERGREKVIEEWHYEKAFAPVISRMSNQLAQES